MKIGLVLSNTPAYSETFFNSKIKGLIKNGIEVELFVSNSTESFHLCKVNKAPSKHAENPLRLLLTLLFICSKLLCYLPRVVKLYKLYRLEKRSFKSLFKSLYFNSHILTSKNIDCLHFGFATQAIGKELVAKAINAKMAVSFRGFDITVYPIKHPNCYHLLWKHVDRVHSISKYLLHKSNALGLNCKVPYQIITPAVVIDTFDIKLNEKQKTKGVQILTIARLHWIKGIDLLIETALLLKENQFDFSWTIIGDGDQKRTERYLYHIHEKGLQNHVKLRGKLSHQETLFQLQKASIYVQSSLNEGFCNAVLEAQASGNLCVAFNVGGLSENIIDNKTGWLIPERNSSLLASKIKEVNLLSKAQKTQIIIAAKNRVNTNFTIEQQEQKFVNFYKEIIN